MKAIFKLRHSVTLILKIQLLIMLHSPIFLCIHIHIVSKLFDKVAGIIPFYSLLFFSHYEDVLTITVQVMLNVQSNLF